MQKGELEKFEQSLENVMQMAQSYGLDFFEMRFELVPADILYTFGAYQGMPTRFSHWSFGKEKHHFSEKMTRQLSLRSAELPPSTVNTVPVT